MPSRVIKKSTVNMPGIFPSLKNPDGIMFESTLERDYCYYPELDPSISFYEGQPLTLEFEIRSKRRRYTPDFLLIYAASNDKTLIEVKRQQVLLDDEGMVIKLNTVREELNKLGYIFKIIDETFIRVEPRLGNLKKLYKYRKLKLENEEKNIILKLLESQKKYQISEIGLITNIKDILPKVLHLASKSELQVDFNSPIDTYSYTWGI